MIGDKCLPTSNTDDHPDGFWESRASLPSEQDLATLRAMRWFLLILLAIEFIEFARNAYCQALPDLHPASPPVLPSLRRSLLHPVQAHAFRLWNQPGSMITVRRAVRAYDDKTFTEPSHPEERCDERGDCMADKLNAGLRHTHNEVQKCYPES